MFLSPQQDYKKIGSLSAGTETGSASSASGALPPVELPAASNNATVQLLAVEAAAMEQTRQDEEAAGV